MLFRKRKKPYSTEWAKAEDWYLDPDLNRFTRLIVWFKTRSWPDPWGGFDLPDADLDLQLSDVPSRKPGEGIVQRSQRIYVHEPKV